MREYFPKPKSLEANVKIELGLSNYAKKKKADLKNATDVDASGFAKKTDLANSKSGAYKLDDDKWKNVPAALRNLKSKVEKLDLGKLQTTPVDLIKLNNVVKIWCCQKGWM